MISKKEWIVLFVVLVALFFMFGPIVAVAMVVGVGLRVYGWRPLWRRIRRLGDN